MFLLGMALILLCFGSVIIILGGHIANYTDIPSLLGVIIPVLAVVAAGGSFKVFYQGLRAVFFPKAEITEEVRGQAATLFRLLSKTAAIAAAMVSLLGISNALGSLDFSNPGAINYIGPNISAALIGPVYGLILVMAVFEPAVFVLKKRYSGKR